ncbi:MAG: ribonuclease toxin immunity protein CdiI [Myxococcales bacterium]|nr:ribonuclease toxin immunity protein CdiI [Myxococcales bacterium]
MPTATYRVVIEDPTKFAVQAFFNAISDDSFVRTVTALLNSVGASFNDAHCEFPGDLDPGDPPFEGVRFSLYEDEVVLSVEEMLRVLVEACSVQRVVHPEQREAIDDLLRQRALDYDR